MFKPNATLFFAIEIGSDERRMRRREREAYSIQKSKLKTDIPTLIQNADAMSM